MKGLALRILVRNSRLLKAGNSHEVFFFYNGPNASVIQCILRGTSQIFKGVVDFPRVSQKLR